MDRLSLRTVCAPTPKTETCAASRTGPCRQYRHRRPRPDVPGPKHDQPWHPPQTDEPQFELTRRAGGRRQRGRNGHKAANQMLTEHLTECLTDTSYRSKTPVKHRQINRDSELVSRSHHENSKAPRARTSANEQSDVKGTPTTRQKRSVPNDQSLGTLLTSRWGRA